MYATEHGPIMDVQAMARGTSSIADAEGPTDAAEAGAVKSSTATAGAPFGDFTPDEEKRFLASADGDKVEAMRRYKAALVRMLPGTQPMFVTAHHSFCC